VGLFKGIGGPLDRVGESFTLEGGAFSVRRVDNGRKIGNLGH
jgi:hypothetical protein